MNGAFRRIEHRDTTDWLDTSEPNRSLRETARHIAATLPFYPNLTVVDSRECPHFGHCFMTLVRKEGRPPQILLNQEQDIQTWSTIQVVNPYNGRTSQRWVSQPQTQEAPPAEPWHSPFQTSGDATQLRNLEEENYLQNYLSSEKGTESFRAIGEEDIELAHMMIGGDPARDNQELLNADVQRANAILAWKAAKDRYKVRVRELASRGISFEQAETAIREFEEIPNAVMEERYVGERTLPVPREIRPAAWIQVKERYKITEADVSLACFANNFRIDIRDVLEAVRIRNWHRAKQDLEMLSDVLKEEFEVSETLADETVKSFRLEKSNSKLKCLYTPLDKDPSPEDQLVKEETEDPPSENIPEASLEATERRIKSENPRETHLENLKQGTMIWHPQSGSWDHVKVSIAIGNKEFPLFLVIDSGSPKSILNMRALTLTAEKDESYKDLNDILELSAQRVPKLEGENGLYIDKAVVLKMRWSEPDYEPDKPVNDEADYVLEAFGLARKINRLKGHGLLGRDFLAAHNGLYSPGSSPEESKLSISPYSGR
ncbi:MAG TPA: hypothetical protein VLS45_01115, partial [Methylomicrobium sp.]|nr:hypothetical protein [Methylomicrobium sp.]